MKRTLHRSGFTLLEMIIVMVIISTLLASAFVLLQKPVDDRLSQLSRETQVLAKQTLSTAKNEQRPYYIVLTHSAIWATTTNPSFAEDDADLAPPPGAIKFSDNIKLDYRPPNDNQWYRLNRDSLPYVWVFSRSGLSQQISIRFVSENGSYEATFHPLTASETVE